MSALDTQTGGTHYKDMPIQPIEFITKNKLDWFQGNIVKYAARHHSKGGAEDLKKVIHYAELALEMQYGTPQEDPRRVPNETPEAVKRGSTEPAPTDELWVQHLGNTRPGMLNSTDVVVCRFRDGRVSSPRMACDYSWIPHGDSGDIVGWRRV